MQTAFDDDYYYYYLAVAALFASSENIFRGNKLHGCLVLGSTTTTTIATTTPNLGLKRNRTEKICIR